MATVELRDAYFIVSVHRDSRKYLKFSFHNKLYSFTCLPFGLCSAPYIFTKIIRPIVKYLREYNVCCVVYLDDFLILGYTENECKKNVSLTVNLPESLGFIIIMAKSM